MSDMEKDKAASAVKGARDLCNAILDAKTREERRLLNTERYARLAPEIPADAVVKCVLSKAYSSGPPPDALFKRLLTELGEKGRVDLVIAALRWLLESHGVPQAPDVFIGALSVCCSNFNPKLAQWVFSLMQQHGVPQPLLSYNLLLTAYSNAGLVDEAFEAYSLMRQKGVMPNTFTFLTIIQGCNFKRMGRYDRAVAAFQDMQQAVLHPPAVVKMALLQVCEAAMDKSESWQQAMKVFLVLQQLELENRTIVFNALLRACARVGAWQKALDIFEHMRRIWVEADTGTYNAMLKACVQGGEVDKAFEVYEWMVEGRGGSDAGVKADTETYNILIQGCHRRGMLEKALEAMAWMQGCGVEFDQQTYAELEDTLDISRLWDEKVQNTEEPSDGSAAVLLPDMLRSGPFDGMRMAYLQDQVQLLEDRILSVARCGGRSSWVPATMLPGPHADFVAAAEQQAVVDQVAAIFPPLGGVRAPAVRCVPNHSVLRALGPSIKAPSALLAKSTGYSMQGTWDWALRSKRNPTTEPRLR